MPLLLGQRVEDLDPVPGVSFLAHPQGVYLCFNNRRGIRQLWHSYYPFWQLSHPCLSAKLIALCTKQNLTIAMAESCSGGGIASAITDYAGASKVFIEGLVVYSAQAKSRLLGVAEEELPPGCVDANLTLALAEKVRTSSGSSLGLAITGALGPQSPAERVNVGQVYIAVAGFSRSVVGKFFFPGDRLTVKQAAIDAGINFMLTFIARWWKLA